MGRRGVLPHEVTNAFFNEAERALKQGNLSMASGTAILERIE
jgi:hypothetical protein